MDLKKNIKRTGLAVADLLLPRVCIACGERLLLDENHICLHCLADIPLTYFWERDHNPMADRFNAVIQDGIMETDGQDIVYERYAHAAALFYFSSDAPYRHILYALKYQGRTDLGRYFSKMLGVRLAAAEAFGDVDCVVPVPLHWLRRWRRGYNQAEIIAGEVALALGTEVRTDVLKRVRRTRTQTKMNVEEKGINVAGAFRAYRKGASPKHILIVDDLFTTGSTVCACFTALRAIFPPSVRISVATLGFVGGA